MPNGVEGFFDFKGGDIAQVKVYGAVVGPEAELFGEDELGFEFVLLKTD